METEGIFHGNDGNEQQGCSLDPQSSSFLLQGHSSSSSSSKPSGAGGRLTLAHPGFSPWMNSLFPPLPAVNGMILSQLSCKWNLPGIREGFSTRWARGGMLRIHIPLENPSLGAQGGAQPPKFHKNSAAPPPLPNSPSLSRRFQRDSPPSHGSAPCPGRAEAAPEPCLAVAMATVHFP